MPAIGRLKRISRRRAKPAKRAMRAGCSLRRTRHCGESSEHEPGGRPRGAVGGASSRVAAPAKDVGDRGGTISEESRGGKECVRSFRDRGWTDTYKNK